MLHLIQVMRGMARLNSPRSELRGPGPLALALRPPIGVKGRSNPKHHIQIRMLEGVDIPEPVRIVYLERPTPTPNQV